MAQFARTPRSTRRLKTAVAFAPALLLLATALARAQEPRVSLGAPTDVRPISASAGFFNAGAATTSAPSSVGPSNTSLHGPRNRGQRVRLELISANAVDDEPTKKAIPKELPNTLSDVPLTPPAAASTLQATEIPPAIDHRPPPMGRHGCGGCGHCTSCSAAGRGGCYPGRQPCYPCEHDGPLGRFLCDLYECVCCPDPCYEPRWLAQADAAFWADAPRPVTQQRIRWDAITNLVFPDRSEFFWARADGVGRGPRPIAPALGAGRVRSNELLLFTETAAGPGFSALFEMPYRSSDPDLAPHGSGFGDLSIGTKSLLFDCEMLQVAFQMKTYMPVGKTSRGVGVGHVSLEPSILTALKLCEHTHIQAQLTERIPIAGDPEYAGSVMMSHLSVNHVLWRFLPDVPLIVTGELNTYSFQDGLYTDPVLGPFQKASGETYVTMGPGFRLVICDKVDFGFAAAYTLHGPANTQYYRTEARVRY